MYVIYSDFHYLLKLSPLELTFQCFHWKHFKMAFCHRKNKTLIKENTYTSIANKQPE